MVYKIFASLMRDKSGVRSVVRLIRDFELSDIPDVVEILRTNNQFEFPEVDGPEAMKRVRNCAAVVFLVCQGDSGVVGCIRGTYDGSRAMIHQLSVHPSQQKKGIGTTLVKSIIQRFSEKGAPTVSAEVMQESLGFWVRIGFKKTGVFVLGNW